jgi:hypothetical protein
MNVYTVTLERVSTGERAGSMVTRQATAIRDAEEADDLGIVAVEVRP